jgi:hypothetical protein
MAVSWADRRARLLGKAPALTLDELLAAIRERDAQIYVQDGRAHYAGHAPDDRIQAGIEQHQATLVEVFTYAPSGRCVFTDCYRLLANGDPIACQEHRAKVDAS